MKPNPALAMPFPGSGVPGGYRVVGGQLVPQAALDAQAASVAGVTDPATSTDDDADAGTEPDTAPRRKNRKE